MNYGDINRSSFIYNRGNFYKSDEDYDDFSFFKIWGGILSTVGFLFTMYGFIKVIHNFSRKISL